MQQEYQMTESTQSFVEMLKQFGSDLGLPRVDVDKLIETHRKNIDALGQSAQVAAEGAQSLVTKQREIVEAAFGEVSAMARDFKPMGNPQEVLSKQAEFAKKAFDITVQNTREIAELTRQSATDATRIIKDRLKDSLVEIGASIDRKVT
jgi:phasin family protein